MFLLVNVLRKDAGPVQKCLPLKNAKMRRGCVAMMAEVTDSPQDAYALEWDLPEVNQFEQGLGACMLWRPDERMCLLVPPAEQRDENNAWDARCPESEWTYYQTLKVSSELVLKKTYCYYDGEGLDPIIYSALGMDNHRTSGQTADISLVFCQRDHGTFDPEMGGEDEISVDKWPNVFQMLTWDKGG